MKLVKLIVVAVIVMAMTGCGGGSPTTREVNVLIIDTEVIHKRLVTLSGGNFQRQMELSNTLKIENQYTRTENGVTVFYYDFNFGGECRGTIRIEKAGDYWKSRLE